uniref:MAM domain-containing protein, meprin/A5/mu n=1 Tax=Candidatus Kentrum sp. MB TaxID=2138164 RepID=A0A450XPN6_9GAMM|nr:MAG: MAM domain-containing protein, meprin/A5/mu [Candidatus Kentron sp. MB]VFK75368.1 MAG: MAM domain-containing protein, meprin/A5/mu [Candidatus Kentron sp. MB]
MKTLSRLISFPRSCPLCVGMHMGHAFLAQRARTRKPQTRSEPHMNTILHPFRPFVTTLAILFLSLGAIPPAHAAEHVINFEAGLSGWSAVKGTSYFNWARHAGGTHSGHTGPNEAEEGNYYLYLEASRNTPSRIAYFQSPDFPETIKRVSFHYHMYGAHMGTLTLEGFDGSRWLQLWRVSGQQHGSHYAPWTRKELDLSARTIRKVRFKGVTGSGPGKLYRGDMAIDFITLTTSKEVSAGHWSKSGDDVYFANGNVGIGIKDPKADLAVLGNLSKALSGHIAIAKGSINVTGVGTRFTKDLAAGDSLLIKDQVFRVAKILSDTELNLNAAHPTGALNATAYTDGDLLSVHTGAEVSALTIDKSGNVGIGAAAPKATLEAKGPFIRKVFVATGLGPGDETDPAAGGRQIKSRVLNFTKLHADTAIRILYSDNLRVHRPDNTSIARWEIRINGAHPPGGAIYQDKHSHAGQNDLEPATILGYATGVPSGNHQIQIWVNIVPGYAAYAADTYTGWSNSRWTLEAQEVWMQ